MDIHLVITLALYYTITYAFASLRFSPALVHCVVPMAPAWLPAQQTPRKRLNLVLSIT